MSSHNGKPTLATDTQRKQSRGRKAGGFRRKTDATPRKVVGSEPTLMRTKRLLNAALKVWELKNGYRPDPEFKFGYQQTFAKTE